MHGPRDLPAANERKHEIVAAVSSSLGLYNASVTAGAAQEGNASEGVFVNTAIGNLVLQSRDEVLVGQGLNVALTRTYNSQGLLDDDNADNWRIGVYRNISGLTGTVNTDNSFVTKTFSDGAAILYRYDATRGLYVSTDGSGAHDTLKYDSGTSRWAWQDGTTQRIEIYYSTGKIIQERDQEQNPSPNVITYTCMGNLLTQISDASGQVTNLVCVGASLSQIEVVSQGVTTMRRTASRRCASICRLPTMR